MACSLKIKQQQCAGLFTARMLNHTCSDKMQERRNKPRRSKLLMDSKWKSKQNLYLFFFISQKNSTSLILEVEDAAADLLTFIKMHSSIFPLCTRNHEGIFVIQLFNIILNRTSQ